MSTLKDNVYQNIYQKIVSGELPPGTRLPGELQLASELNISRVTLRGALCKLEQEGLILRSRQLGTVIKSLPIQEKKVLIAVKNDLELENHTMQVIAGISAFCSQYGVEFDIMSFNYISASPALNDRYMGIINTGCCYSGEEKYLQVLKDSKLPTVNVIAFERDYAISKETTILNDSSAAWQDGLKHLFQFGHRKVGFLLNHKKIIEARFDCSFDDFMEKIEEYFLNSRKLILFPETDGHYFSGITKLFNTPDPLTAFYCYKGSYALDVYKFAKEQNINISSQLAVLAFSGGSSAPLLNPPLSTVDFNHQRLGRIAAKVLLDHEKWEHLPEKPKIILPHSINGRKSTDFFRVNLY